MYLRLPPPGTKITPRIPKLYLEPFSRAIERLGVYLYNRVIHPSEMGLYHKLYNPRVHGPYCHWRWYGKQDARLLDTKLADIPAWFARRDKSVGAMWNEFVRNAYLIRQKWVGPLCTNPLKLIFQAIFFYCFIHWIFSFNHSKDFRSAAYHW